ncbi:hypothetical protein [Bradyrhizobium sp.]|jgi:hypothetical protein|uniref:hypothetical protein n=1 Tax=Bradyrhizobium sp. TaxID=376 RepID=UPI003C42C921
MKIALLLILFVIAPSAEGPPAAEPTPNEISAIHEQIKADRAKAKAPKLMRKTIQRLVFGIATQMENGLGIFQRKPADDGS